MYISETITNYSYSHSPTFHSPYFSNMLPSASHPVHQRLVQENVQSDLSSCVRLVTSSTSIACSGGCVRLPVGSGNPVQCVLGISTLCDIPLHPSRVLPARQDYVSIRLLYSEVAFSPNGTPFRCVDDRSKASGPVPYGPRISSLISVSPG